MRKNRLLMKHGNVSTIILAGGEGTRLKPLTDTRCKPAVSFGGRYRLIDVAISNAIHANCKNIYVLSQFLASTLNNYLLETYQIDAMHGAHIEVLSPEETYNQRVWYEGTADAVRKNLSHLLASDAEYFIILSGDQLYSMDLEDMLTFAKENDADLTIATIPIGEAEAKRMGVMKINSQFEITNFFEKPQDKKTLMQFAIAPHVAAKHNALDDLSYLGSMGIYIFKRKALINLLKEDSREDFGKHLIPTQLQKGKTFAYIFDGYWEDVGTISSYFDANLKLTQNRECLDLYNEMRPIYSQLFTLPSPRITKTLLKDAIICDGSLIEAKEITHSMIGMKTHIGNSSIIRDSVIMGWAPHSTRKPICIGSDCHLENVIVDEGAKIGNCVQLIGSKALPKMNNKNLTVQDGILVVKAGANIPNNFKLM